MRMSRRSGYSCLVRRAYIIGLAAAFEEVVEGVDVELTLSSGQDGGGSQNGRDPRSRNETARPSWFVRG